MSDSALSWTDFIPGYSTASSLFDKIYGVYSNERNRSDQLEQLQITRDREDNAVRRRVADLKQAGLHPTLAVGGGAAASASPATVSSPRQTSSDNSAPLMAGLQRAQIANMQAQTAMTLAEAQRISKETELIQPRFDLHQTLTNAQVGQLHQQIAVLAEEHMTKYLHNQVGYGEGVIEARRQAEKLEPELKRIVIRNAELANQTGQVDLKILKRDLDTYNFRLYFGSTAEAVRSVAPIINGVIKKRPQINHTYEGDQIINKYFK